MQLFSKYGMTAEWMSRKETMRLKEEYPVDELFTLENCGIKVTNKENDLVSYLNHGVFGKLCFEYIYPTYVAYSQLYYFGLGNTADK